MVIPYHRPYKIDVDFSDIFESGNYTNDVYCRELEKRIGNMYHCEALACSSGTQGLLLAINNFMRLEKYITLPAFNWFSDKYVLELLNKEIIFQDIDRNTWLGYSTHIGLHTFGSCDNSYRPFIYDGTHALGTKLKDLGCATVISLAPTKMVTSAEGGLILTRYPNEELTELRDKCSRMSEFHAKIGLSYLPYLDTFKAFKKRIYEYYKSNLDGVFQEIPYDSNYNTIGMLSDLEIPKEIQWKQYYEPLKRGLPNTDYVYEKMKCLPSWYGVDYKKVVDIINEYNSRSGKQLERYTTSINYDPEAFRYWSTTD
jgi:dTDP-4-amino-4,6-dideoxygalactose transaminase